ncbi:MAG: hypothetical protein P8Y45_22355 [Exilibacterium sp.]
MNIAIINSTDFWSMGWATDPESQQQVVESLVRGGVNVEVFEVASKRQLLAVLEPLKQKHYLVWPNAYKVYAFEGSQQTLWLADLVKEQGFGLIGSDATTLRHLMLKDQCQSVLEKHSVAIPYFAAIDDTMLGNLQAVLQARGLSFPLFVKPNALSTSKGITQDCVVHDLDSLRRQIKKLGEQFSYPVMVEEYLPGQDITVAVFRTPERPIILATYYDTEIYDDPAAVLDHSVRLLDWNDRKWLRVVSEPEVLAKIESVALATCRALDIHEFTRMDCRMDRHGNIKVFDVNGYPGLELPFSTTVWQMIVKMHEKPQRYAFDTLIALVIYCVAHRHNLAVPVVINQLAQAYIAEAASAMDCLSTA